MKLVTLQVTAQIPDNEDGDAMENALTEILSAHEWNASVTLVEVTEVDPEGPVTTPELADKILNDTQ